MWRNSKPDQPGSRANKRIFGFSWRRSQKDTEAAGPHSPKGNPETIPNSPPASKAQEEGKGHESSADTSKIRPTTTSQKELPQNRRLPPSRKLSLPPGGIRRTGKEQDQLHEAIDKLNRSVVQLYKITAVLQGNLKPEEWSKVPNLNTLNVETLDEGIKLVATVTQQPMRGRSR